MRLTVYADLGLRALMRLAGEPGRRFTAGELAAELAVSRHHLVKVVAALADAGIVQTQRGAGGGFSLARSPEKISLGEAVRVLEQGSALVECFRADGGQCVLTPVCRLRRHLSAASEAFLAKLDGTSLASCAIAAPPHR